MSTAPSPGSELPVWNLSPIVPKGASEDALLAELTRVKETVVGFAGRHKGGVGALGATELASSLSELEQLLGTVWRPGLYTSLAFSTDTTDPKIRALRSKVQEKITELTNELEFFDIEIKTAPEPTFSTWVSSPALARYHHHLKRLRALAPHTLSEPEERLDSTKQITGVRAWSRLYTELTSAWTFDLPADGDTRPKSLAEIRALRSHADRDVRRKATELLLGRFADNNQVLTYLTNTIYQDHRLDLGVRGYKTPIDPTLIQDELTIEVVDALMRSVEEAYPLAHRYYRIKAKALGISDFSSWDLLAPWEKEEKKISWQDARSHVLAAYRTVSSDFAALAEAFFEERRIDAGPRPGKRDGAFCSGMIPGIAPYVFLNYTGRLDDVSTLAHELGHGVHFALAQRRQTLFNFDPTTPMAETASVFGEAVLTERLLEEERDPKVRRTILASRIEDAIATIFRQVAYTRYERNAHDRCAEGIATPEELSALWSTEMNRLYGDSVAFGDLDRWGWITIPHLVAYRFYCYSYAFGMLLVLALYRRWREEGDAFVPRYIELLSAGGSDAPIAMLSRVGIDIASASFWRQGLDHLAGLIDQFEKVAFA